LNLSDLKTAETFASSTGFKAIVYGAPGSAKTPLINTAPRPLVLICEPGMLSMKGSKVPAYEAYTGAKIDEFFDWWFKSNETKNFDTLAIDSASQMADIYLQDALNGKSKSGNKKHGLAAYGEMADEVIKHLRPLFFQPHKHCYIICKQTVEDGIKKPYFLGKQLPTEVPHLYDAILHLGIHNVPIQGVGQALSFQCRQSYDTVARDRSGKLNEFEPPDFKYIVGKAMG
jgi:hypothetical protein